MRPAWGQLAISQVASGWQRESHGSLSLCGPFRRPPSQCPGPPLSRSRRQRGCGPCSPSPFLPRRPGCALTREDVHSARDAWLGCRPTPVPPAWEERPRASPARFRAPRGCWQGAGAPGPSPRSLASSWHPQVCGDLRRAGGRPAGVAGAGRGARPPGTLGDSHQTRGAFVPPAVRARAGLCCSPGAQPGLNRLGVPAAANYSSARARPSRL